jgi:Lon protease-like protein
MLPLFPLSTVLFPGLPLPLHIFEPRYRHLVADLLAGPRPARFAVVAIREGRETGVDGARSLYEIGCTATLRDVSEYPDGRYDLVTVGARRFRLGRLDSARPYLRAEAELLGEGGGDETAAPEAARAVRTSFTSYLAALARRHGGEPAITGLPDDPVRLSYLVAAAMVVDLPAKQSLLAEPDAAARLTAELALLARETALLRALTSAPAPELRTSPYHPN